MSVNTSEAIVWMRACVSDTGLTPHSVSIQTRAKNAWQKPPPPCSVIADDSEKPSDQMGDVIQQASIGDLPPEAILDAIRKEGWAMLKNVSDPVGYTVAGRESWHGHVFSPYFFRPAYE